MFVQTQAKIIQTQPVSVQTQTVSESCMRLMYEVDDGFCFESYMAIASSGITQPSEVYYSLGGRRKTGKNRQNRNKLLRQAYK